MSADENPMVESSVCGRCYAECLTFPAPCAEQPEKLLGAPIGMYHCPDCGAMVLAGLPHPHICQQCINELTRHEEKTTSR